MDRREWREMSNADAELALSRACVVCGQLNRNEICPGCDGKSCDNCGAPPAGDDRFCQLCREATVKECSCGAHFDRDSFDALELVGVWNTGDDPLADDDETLILRLCDCCGSSIAIEARS